MTTPDKIYYTSYGDIRENVPINDDDLVYVRPDDLLEKACDAYCQVCGHYPHTTPTHICRHNCNYFDDFRHYLKKLICD